MYYTNAARLPDSLYYLLSHPQYHQEEGEIGVTSLIDSPRIRVLRLKFEKDIFVEASDSIFALLGTAVHSLLSLYPHGVSEQRLSISDPRWNLTLGGTPDLVEPPVLYDYKTTSTWTNKFGTRPEWTPQLNVYRWLWLKTHSEPINELKVVAIFRDWSAANAKKYDDYPLYPVGVFDIPLWILDDTETYIHERMRLHTEAEIDLPECTAEERWAKEPLFAVHVRRKKTAERVFGSLEDARGWALERDKAPLSIPLVDSPDDTYDYCIVKRPEQWKRCERYCNTAMFCDQYRTFQKASSSV